MNPSEFEREPISLAEVEQFADKLEHANVILRLRQEDILRGMWRAALARKAEQTEPRVKDASFSSEVENTWEPEPFQEDPDL